MSKNEEEVGDDPNAESDEVLGAVQQDQCGDEKHQAEREIHS